MKFYYTIKVLLVLKSNLIETFIVFIISQLSSVSDEEEAQSLTQTQNESNEQTASSYFMARSNVTKFRET